MSRTLIIINNVTFATKTEVGKIEGFGYDDSTDSIVAKDFKLGINTKTPPLTEARLIDAQSEGYYIGYPIVPKLGETAYWLELDDNGIVTKVSPYLTPEQEAEYKKAYEERKRRRAVEAVNNTPGLLEAMKALS